MNSLNCLNFDQIYRYISKEASQNEKAAVEKEASICETCAKKIQLLESIYSARPSTITQQSKDLLGLEPDRFFLYEEKFFNNELTEDELDSFCDALLKSPEYMEGFKNIMGSMRESDEIGEKDREVLERINATNVEDRLSVYEKECLQSRVKRQKIIRRPIWFPEINFNKPATLFAFAVVSFFALFFYLGYQKNVSDTTLKLAAADYNDAVQSLPVTMEDFRLSGTDANEFVSFKRTRSVDNTSTTHSIENIEKALKLSPNDAKLNHKMGVMKYLNGHSKEAVKLLKKAINLDKDYTPPYNDLSLIKIEEGKPKEALELLQVALKKSPDFLEAQFNLAIIYEQLKENQKAILAWEEYLKREKNGSVIKAVKFRIQELQQN